ncbi:nucleotide pyrophosphohydrolase [Candidatus Peregrinibacteria bacterium]|nr:nucleotide pyrophosphohydrolase [Candidatus Peregrinibacteria bacterium]
MPKKTFEDLVKIAEKLRSETGCPWDKKQTIASMLTYIDEEVSEVREAIENGDHENLREELGDVLFQLIMIAQIAKEHEYFDMDDVVNDISDKIISRHTWVFGNDKAETPEEALEMWRKNKEIEKAKKNKKK